MTMSSIPSPRIAFADLVDNATLVERLLKFTLEGVAKLNDHGTVSAVGPQPPPHSITHAHRH
jgi:hypothetical protein